MFELYNDELVYKNNDQRKGALARDIVKECKAEKDGEVGAKSGHGRNLFSITTKGDKDRTYYCAASTPQERDAWVNAISHWITGSDGDKSEQGDGGVAAVPEKKFLSVERKRVDSKNADEDWNRDAMAASAIASPRYDESASTSILEMEKELRATKSGRSAETEAKRRLSFNSQTKYHVGDVLNGVASDADNSLPCASSACEARFTVEGEQRHLHSQILCPQCSCVNIVLRAADAIEGNGKKPMSLEEFEKWTRDQQTARREQMIAA